MEWMLVAFLGGLASLYYYRNSLLVPVKIEQDADAVYQTWTEIPYSIRQPSSESHWNRAVLVVTQHEIRFQTRQEKAVRFNAIKDELRGFWVVGNEAFIHAHISTSWYVVQVRLIDNKKFVQALSQITPRAMHTPLPTTLAQDATKEVTLFLAPHTLVILTGGLVVSSIDLADISDISASGDELHFSANGQVLNFTLLEAETWAHALKTASVTGVTQRIR
ncbi:MAG: hypothetical protein Q9P44_06565 [Anaerolineae bacterium]|nr:hypothetical protein [Anaerolineae bacterium]